jgi:hypothetical protein
MHRKLLPALGASAIFVATVLNAAAAPLDPAATASSRFTADEASLAQTQVVAVPTTWLLQGFQYTTSYARLYQFLQTRLAGYDDLGNALGYEPVASGQATNLAERAFDY